MSEPGRREELAEGALDYALRRGVADLTLRPLAAALGTSDRMLLYHFDSRDDLVLAVIVRTVDRATAAVERLPDAPSVRSGVNRLWEAYRSEPLRGCLHVYCQAAATGLIGQEPYRGAARDANARWAQSLRDYLVRCGASPRRVARVVRLVDSSLYGFHLDLVTDRAEELARGVDDLARAAEALA